MRLRQVVTSTISLRPRSPAESLWYLFTLKMADLWLIYLFKMVILQFPMSVYLRLNQVSIYMNIRPYTSIDLKSAARKSRKTQPMRIFAPTSMALFNKKPKTLEFCWADLFVWGKFQSCRVAKFQRSHEITNELRSWCQLVSDITAFSPEKWKTS